MDYAIIQAPFGQLRLTVDHEFLVGIEFLLARHAPVRPLGPLLVETEAQLAAYFRNPTHRFSLPIMLEGTDFQRRVWQALAEIPVGAPMTYGQLANRLGTAARAIGNACGANPLPIVVPCHRVVSASGLGGFMNTQDPGPLNIKSWLLAHECRK